MTIPALKKAQNQAPAIKKYDFPFRLPAHRLAGVYASLEAAFAARDYLYVARFANDNPELHGCALIMLGNRVGGERILDRHNIRSARSCLYRAFGAWQHDDPVEARRWIAEGKSAGGDGRLDKLAALIERQNFRIVFHCDIDGYVIAKICRTLPGFDVVITRHLQKDGPGTLPIGQPLASIVPQGPPIDFILLDDLKMVPVGIGDLNAPVIANVHDNEWYDSYLDKVMPEIDFISTGSTSDMVEIARPFDCPGTVCFYHFPMQTPSLPPRFADFFSGESRATDLFYSSADITHDCYHYKRQDILSLADLDPRFAVKIVSRSYPFETYCRQLRNARFSINSTRCANNLSNRAVEAIYCGSLHLVEEENGFPYIFSEKFHCFPVYRHAHMRADVEKHLGRYDEIRTAFRPQLPQFEREFHGLLPTEDKTRLLRYLRRLLFLVHVEAEKAPARARPKPDRKLVYVDQYDYFVPFPDQLERLIKQTPPSHGLRRAFAEGRLAEARGAQPRQSLEALLQSVEAGLAEFPDSLALYHVRGIAQRFLDLDEEADKSFNRVTSGALRLLPTDQTSMRLGRFNSFYWLADAHIRARRPKELESLVPVEDVWLSYAWANRADLALHRAFAHTHANRESEAAGAFAVAADFAKRALDLFMCNGSAQSVYLRAAFALSADNEAWADEFLQSFEAARRNDYIFLHNFAAPVVHLLTARKRRREAEKIIEDVKRFIDRVRLLDHHYLLYPEFVPLLYRYNVPNKKLDKMS